MLTNITDDGHMDYTCGKCRRPQRVHVSHEDVRFYLHPGAPIYHRTVGLPTCGCGSTLFLKVDFSESDLQASNMLDRDGHPTESHVAAHRHMTLARHMERLGKPLD